MHKDTQSALRAAFALDLPEGADFTMRTACAFMDFNRAQRWNGLAFAYVDRFAFVADETSRVLVSALSGSDCPVEIRDDLVTFVFAGAELRPRLISTMTAPGHGKPLWYHVNAALDLGHGLPMQLVGPKRRMKRLAKLMLNAA